MWTWPHNSALFIPPCLPLFKELKRKKPHRLLSFLRVSISSAFRRCKSSWYVYVCVCVWQREWKRGRENVYSEAETDPLIIFWFEVSVGSPWQAQSAEQITQQALHSLRWNPKKSSLCKSLGWLCFSERKQRTASATKNRKRGQGGNSHLSATALCAHLGHLLSIFSFLYLSHLFRFKIEFLSTSLCDSFGKTDWGKWTNDRIIDWFAQTERRVINDPNGHLLISPGLK